MVNKNYRHIYREKKSLISSEAHIRQHLEQRDILGSTHGYVFLYALDGVAEEFHRDRESRKWRQLGRKLLRPGFFKSLLKEGDQARYELRSYLRWLNQTDLRTLSRGELSSAFLRAYTLYSRIRGYFKTYRPEFQVAAESKLRSILVKKIQDTVELQTVIETLTTPHELHNVDKEFIDWVRVVSGKQTRELIFDHIAKYPWLVAQSYDHAEILRAFFKKYRQDRGRISELERQVRLLLRAKAELKKKQAVWLRRLKDPTVKYLSWLFQRAALERLRLKGGWAGADFFYFPLYHEISRRTKVPLKDLYSFYRLGDVVKAIKLGRPVVSAAEFKKRKFAYIFWIKGGRLNFYSGVIALRLIKRELKHVQKKADQDGLALAGHIASTGIARGRVRIVVAGDLSMLREAFKKFKKGDVMVTTMTQPNAVPLMKKAAAVVADEGGLISHAAVIAREFGIPCLVGTEIATKVFKDGDMVEVDALKGVVRKINK